MPNKGAGMPPASWCWRRPAASRAPATCAIRGCLFVSFKRGIVERSSTERSFACPLRLPGMTIIGSMLH
jgi:hypothetical protein